MAKQKGIIKLEGTIGDITFLKTKDGYLAKEKTSIAPGRIRTDAAFQRTRENNQEFGRAGKAGKVLRNAVRSLMQNAKDSRVTSRLTKVMITVLQADATSLRGQRNVLDGEAELLEGFEFNEAAKLSATLFTPYTATVNRTTGAATLNIPAFVPAQSISAPDGVTHFKIVSGATAIDFEGGTSVTDLQDSGILPWDNLQTAAITLAHTLPPASEHPVFLLMGIIFYQKVNGADYPLKNGVYNTLSIVKVAGV